MPMSHLFSVLGPVIYLAVANIGAGTALMRLFPAQARPREYASGIALLLGQGIYASVLLVAALTKQFTLPVLLALTLPFVLFALYETRCNPWSLVRKLGIAGQAFFGAPLHWKVLTVVTTSLLLSLMASISGIIEGDALAFYLTLPKIIASAHRLAPVPGYEPFMSVGLIAEMQLAALYLLGMPDASVKLYIWLTTLTGIAILGAICSNAGLGRRGRLLAVAIAASSSCIVILMEGKTDFFAAAYGLCAALFALRSWEEPIRRASLMLSGMFLGIALVAKLSYAIAFFPPMLMLLFYPRLVALCQHWREPHQMAPRVLQLVREGAWVALLMLPPFLVHFAKNLIMVGSLNGVQGSFQYFTSETTRHIVLNYPLVLTVGRYWGQLGNISVLLLAWLMLAFVLPARIWRAQPKIVVLLLAGLLGVACWVAMLPAVPIPRYFLATLLILAVPAAWLAERFARSSDVCDNVVVAAAVFCLYIVFNVWSPQVFPVHIASQYLFSGQDPAQSAKLLNINESLSRDGYETINQDAAPGARVFLASYFRFWLRPDLIQTSNNDPENATFKWEPSDPEKLWRQLHEHGFQYLYMDGSQRWKEMIKSPPSWVTVTELYPRGAFFGTSYGSAYKLDFRDAPGTVQWTTKEVAPGAWQVIRSDQRG